MILICYTSGSSLVIHVCCRSYLQHHPRRDSERFQNALRTVPFGSPDLQHPLRRTARDGLICRQQYLAADYIFTHLFFPKVANILYELLGKWPKFQKWHITSFHPRGLKLSFFCSTGSSFRDRADFQNCHIWA